MSKVMADKEMLEQIIRPYIVREKGLFDGNDGSYVCLNWLF